jgi:hypothetical protein
LNQTGRPLVVDDRRARLAAGRRARRRLGPDEDQAVGEVVATFQHGDLRWLELGGISSVAGLSLLAVARCCEGGAGPQAGRHREEQREAGQGDDATAPQRVSGVGHGRCASLGSGFGGPIPCRRTVAESLLKSSVAAFYIKLTNLIDFWSDVTLIPSDSMSPTVAGLPFELSFWPRSEHQMPYQRALPYVDPEAPQSPPRRAALRLMSAPAAVALEGTLSFRLIVWRFTPTLMRLTGGHFARLLPMPIGAIDTRDARNGSRHRRCVLYFHDGERITVIPTKGGLPSDPFWYENALADPNVRFESQPFRAQPVEDEAELRRLWAIAERFFPPSVTYRQRAARTGRTIPILQLH